MRAKIFTTSVKVWDAMIEAIDNAQKSIYIEMYIFEDDTKESHDFLGKLQEKASQGIKIVVVADAFGSKQLMEKSVELEKSGIEFIFFSHWLRHIHRKIVIIDQQTAFIGGVNIGKRFEHWNDLHLLLNGKIVKRLLKSFAYTYQMAGGKEETVLAWRKKRFSYKLRFWLVEHLPNKNIHTLKRHYVERITGAKKSIRIMTPYFAPPRWLISLLDDASRRGVSVQILVPLKSDSSFADRINFHYMEKLSSSEMKFFLMRKMNHSKLLVIDNEEALIGSQNIDPLSFHINAEAGIFFKDEELVAEILQTFEQWRNESIMFQSGKYIKRLADHAIAVIVKIFHPIL